MPKSTAPTLARPARRHNPLEADIAATGLLRNKARKRKAGDDGAEAEEHFVDSKASKKILQIGRDLAEENEVTSQHLKPDSNNFGFEPRAEQRWNDEDEDDSGEEEAWGDEDDVGEDDDIDPEDLDTYNRFLGTEAEDPVEALRQQMVGAQAASQASGGGTSLADIILAKIAAHESGQDTSQEAKPVDQDIELPPKIVDVYSKIGLILSRYKSGKLPKPFKILPTVHDWETIIELTKPDRWTPNACYEATRIFVSAKPLVVQRFLEMVLLDRVRDDIHEHKKLNVHLFNALKRSLYKPSAFFKGFLFPLVGSGTCTLREAHIISAVLARISVPVLHSAAAIKGLCDIAAEEASAGTEGGGATNVFIRVLLEKKYALPYQVIDALVFHFLRFRSSDPASVQEGDVLMDMGSERAAMQVRLPVIWHQCLLAFATRYRNDVTEDQREALLDLLLSHGHRSIGPEVRRELLAGRGRGIPLQPEGPTLDGDDTMMDV